MTWMERLSVEEVKSRGNRPASDRPAHYEAQMSPGITGQYNHELREKAGMHTPPPNPENMGLEGEFDLAGLAKRVAVALDQTVTDVESLCIVQQGSTICFRGQVPSQPVLAQIVEVAGRVDGVKQIDTEQVTVAC
jgi:hypothetical protein